VTGARVLVVDDNPVNLKLARFVLAGAGHDVETADDAIGALACIAVRPPRLVLVDVQMPTIDGLELARRIKANPATRDTVVVALTASTADGDRARSLASGCDGHITKPIDPDRLLAMVANHLAGAPPKGDPR
jgi:two-component system, cell cycle response regulator DivK